MASPLSFLSRLTLRAGCAFLLLAGLAAFGAPVEVPVVQAAPRAVAVMSEFDGVVEPVKQSTVASQATGRISQMAVRAGEWVRSGQLLAVVDDRESRAGLERSQAQVAQAEAELRNAQAHARRTRELQGQGFVSQAALDTAESAFKAALAGRDQATAGQRQSALTQGFTRVTAPYDGWVLETRAQAGELAVPGTPLLILYAPTPLRVVVHVPVSLAAAARAAGQVELLLPGGQGAGTWVKPVGRDILPTADPVAQTQEWRLELPAGAGVTPGQQVRVRFGGSQAQRVVVPASAVLRRGELTAVYVASPQGSFVLKAVRLGADHGAAGVEVLAGLAAGDRVALDPVRAGLAGARPAGQVSP